VVVCLEQDANDLQMLMALHLFSIPNEDKLTRQGKARVKKYNCRPTVLTYYEATYVIRNILLVPFWCDMGRHMLRKLHNCLSAISHLQQYFHRQHTEILQL